jgi:hypothetical protein
MAIQGIVHKGSSKQISPPISKDKHYWVLDHSMWANLLLEVYKKYRGYKLLLYEGPEPIRCQQTR